MPHTWFSPLPRVKRGDPKTVEELENLDEDVRCLELMLSDLKKNRKDLRANILAGNGTEDYAKYLNVVRSQRQAEDELSKLRQERIPLVIFADLVGDSERRGENFPKHNLEEQAKDHMNTVQNRFLAVSAVAFFGAGITFSTIFSGARGSVGLMSYSWACFTIACTICVYTSLTNLASLPPLATVAYPGLLNSAMWSVLFAGFCTFVGVILMGISVALLNLRVGGSVSEVDTRINSNWGGILSLLPAAIGCTLGVIAMLYNAVLAKRIITQRAVRNAARQDQNA